MPGEIRVLIVEDSPTQAKKLQILLESQMFEVEVADNGDDGLAAFLSREFDIVITDVVMPGLNGYELCSRIKAHPTRSQIPVIFLTGQEKPQDRTMGMAAGATSFITKPYDEEDFVRHIMEVLAGLPQPCLKPQP